MSLLNLVKTHLFTVTNFSPENKFFLSPIKDALGLAGQRPSRTRIAPHFAPATKPLTKLANNLYALGKAAMTGTWRPWAVAIG